MTADIQREKFNGLATSSSIRLEFTRKAFQIIPKLEDARIQTEAKRHRCKETL